MFRNRHLSFGKLVLFKKVKIVSVHEGLTFSLFVQCETTIGSQEKMVGQNVREN